MDKSQKRVFLILGIVALFYFASLGTGLWLNSGDGDGQPKNPSDMTDQWVGALGSVLSAFAPRIDLQGLTCNGKAVNRIFNLEVAGHGEKACDVTIPQVPDDEGSDYRKTELSTIGFEGGVYVWAKFDEERFDPKARAENCFLKNQKLPHGLRLEIEYIPLVDDSSTQTVDHCEKAQETGDDMWSCRLLKERNEAVAITALRECATLRLTLRCDGCTEGPGCEQPCPKDGTKSARLKMK